MMTFFIKQAALLAKKANEEAALQARRAVKEVVDEAPPAKSRAQQQGTERAAAGKFGVPSCRSCKLAGGRCRRIGEPGHLGHVLSDEDEDDGEEVEDQNPLSGEETCERCGREFGTLRGLLNHKRVCGSGGGNRVAPAEPLGTDSGEEGIGAELPANVRALLESDGEDEANDGGAMAPAATAAAVKQDLGELEVGALEQELAATLLRSAGVSRIVKQRPSATGAGSGLEYWCVWSGYSEDHATWETVASLRTAHLGNEKLATFNEENSQLLVALAYQVGFCAVYVPRYWSYCFCAEK